jgi:mannitol/fructose-specific phosphotransferase system IIA component (Ntr-type)
MNTVLNKNREISKNLNAYRIGTVAHIKNKNKFDAIKELINKAPDFKFLKHREKLEKAVIESEKIQCTGFGRGVAIAHGKTDEIKDIVVLLGISDKGIQYNSLDGKPVNIMFMIASPPDKPTEYIYALSAVARMLSDDCFKREILTSGLESIKEMVSRAFRNMLLK